MISTIPMTMSHIWYRGMVRVPPVKLVSMVTIMPALSMNTKSVFEQQRGTFKTQRSG